MADAERVRVTTALKPGAALVAQARALAADLGVAYVRRDADAMPALFARLDGVERVVVVQTERLLLVGRDGWEFFFHPNMAYLRLGNILRGGRDLLLEAAQLRVGDAVLDATLGFGAEAILCAHAVGESGRVDGIEAVPELAAVVSDGLSRRVTAHKELNAAMRRVRLVHRGHHLGFLSACPDRSYDVVCFDPFFESPLGAEESLGSLRAFGDHGPLLPEAVAHARRIARRRVLVKTTRWSRLLDELGIAERVGSRASKVMYGVLRSDDDSETAPAVPATGG